MAGAHHHITDEDGGLLEPQQIYARLDNRGDIYECIEQLYGMIWYLAEQNVVLRGTDAKNEDEFKSEAVDNAQLNYKHGLKVSPTERFQPFDEGVYEGQSIEHILNGFVVARGESREFLTKLIENRIKKAKEEGI